MLLMRFAGCGMRDAGRVLYANRIPQTAQRLYPWRCLCLGFLQMIRTTPLRRTTLQFSQIRFTLDLTFITHLQMPSRKRLFSGGR